MSGEGSGSGWRVGGSVVNGCGCGVYGSGWSGFGGVEVEVEWVWIGGCVVCGVDVVTAWKKGCVYSWHIWHS